MNKKDILKRLEHNELFRDALASIVDESERNAINSLARQLISNLADAVLPIIETAKASDNVEQVALEIEHLFSGSTNNSGSK